LVVKVVVAGSAPIRHDAREIVQGAAATMRTTTLREPGCISYRFGFALDEPDDLILVEEWSDEESLAAHLSSDHFAAFSDVLRSALSGPASFTKYDVAGASPLFGS
jgi:quinol monooxygenase YgiN